MTSAEQPLPLVPDGDTLAVILLHPSTHTGFGILGVLIRILLVNGQATRSCLLIPLVA